MSALICGSMAYDTIMVFHDKFKNHILPEKVHILNVSFLVPAMRREYGGCAGNIAYNLKLLQEEPWIMLPSATISSRMRNGSANAASAAATSRCWTTITPARPTSPPTRTITRSPLSIRGR